jgi:hypothetical protein
LIIVSKTDRDLRYLIVKPQRKGAKDEKITKSYGYRTFYNPTPIMRH